jgi:HKD family nuclease
MSRKFLVFPQTALGIGKSKDVLFEAITTADEIWWASAYLTSWPLAPNCIPKSNCTSCNIVVGSDFGITRKAALLDLLKWSKKAMSNVYINEMSGFHPKTILWKSGKKYYALIGSSNLSVAAWSSNVELNAVIDITKEEYVNLTDWFQDYVISISPMLDAKWLKRYHESPRKSKPKTDAIDQINKRIKILGDVDLKIPRQQQKIYNKNKSKFEQLVKSCASAAISREKFYEKMWILLYDSWYGSPVWRITCKKAIWEEACRKLVKIFSSPEPERDRVVKETIDSLGASDNPTRGAWLT